MKGRTGAIAALLALTAALAIEEAAARDRRYSASGYRTGDSGCGAVRFEREDSRGRGPGGEPGGSGLDGAAKERRTRVHLGHRDPDQPHDRRHTEGVLLPHGAER